MSINAIELRIGNWVTIHKKNGGYFYQVANGHDIEEILLCPESCSPISLIAEILKNSGFTSKERTVNFGMSGYFPDTYYYILDGYDKLRNQDYPIYKHGFQLGTFKRDSSFYYQNNRHENKGVQLKYLHELQNLYFALHREELPVTL